MSRYSEEFKRDAVALYENNEDLSLKSASAELGINQASLHSWVKNRAPAHSPARKPYAIKPKPPQNLSASGSETKENAKLRENAIFWARLRNILPTRLTGDPLLVCL